MRAFRVLVAALLVSSSLAAVAPAALATHCLGHDALQPIVDPLGQCRNRPPNAPQWTSWPSSTNVGRLETYCVRVSDPDGDSLREVVFQFWDAGTPDDERIVPGPHPSGSNVCVQYAYFDTGDYLASAGVYDMAGAWAGYSDSPRFYVYR